MNKQSLKLVFFAGLPAFMFSFSSCKKDLGGNVPNIPAAGLMAFNLVPDNGAVGFCYFKQ